MRGAALSRLSQPFINHVTRCKSPGSLKQCFFRSYSQQPPLTRVRHPHLKRGQYATVTEEHISVFNSILSGRVLTGEDDLAGYNRDWLKTVRGEVMVNILLPLHVMDLVQNKCKHECFFSKTNY